MFVIQTISLLHSLTFKILCLLNIKLQHSVECEKFEERGTSLALPGKPPLDSRPKGGKRHPLLAGRHDRTMGGVTACCGRHTVSQQLVAVVTISTTRADIDLVRRARESPYFFSLCVYVRIAED